MSCKCVTQGTPRDCCNTLQHTATHCNTLQHTAPLCTTLQHTATPVPTVSCKCFKQSAPLDCCNTLQHTATYCNTGAENVVQVLHAGTPLTVAIHCNTLQHSATHCDTLQHTATQVQRCRASVSSRTLPLNAATHCVTLHHTATRCNTLQHAATRCNTGANGVAHMFHVGHPPRLRLRRCNRHHGHILFKRRHGPIARS